MHYKNFNYKNFKPGQKIFAVRNYDIKELIFKDYESGWDEQFSVTECGGYFSSDDDFYASYEEARKIVEDEINKEIKETKAKLLQLNLAKENFDKKHTNKTSNYAIN